MKFYKPYFPLNPFGKKPTKAEIKNAIYNRAKTYDQIIHGATALNEQMGPEFSRPTHDIDVMTHDPRFHMDKMEDKLDLLAGYDAFREVIMPIMGREGEYVYKVVRNTIGPKNADVVDYFENRGGIKTTKLKGIRYESIAAAKARLMQILQDPTLRHRHAKTARDLRRIEAYEKSLR